MNNNYSITSKFQVTIPKEIRALIGLTKSDKVRFERKGSLVILKRVPSITDVQKMNRAALKRRGVGKVSDEDIKSARQKFHEQGGKW